MTDLSSDRHVYCRKLYVLCKSQMTGSTSADPIDANDRFIRQLESALCDQLQGGVEVACDAVFGMKVLLALENRLDMLQQQSSTH